MGGPCFGDRAGPQSDRSVVTVNPLGGRRQGGVALTNQEILVTAVNSRKPVTGYYDGRRREFSPHSVGYKGTVLHTHGWQSAGQSKSGLPPGGMWRCLDASKFVGLAIADGEFRQGPPGTEPQTCIDRFIATIYRY